MSHLVNAIWQSLPARHTHIVKQPELTIVFLNDGQMRYYNKAYRKKDYPTDVLSFPVNESAMDETLYVGDILISVEKAGSQAAEKGHSLWAELQILILHGVLHLLGYDHETDTGQMSRLETRLRRKLPAAARKR